MPTPSDTLGNLSVDWLTRFLRQQQLLYPVQFVEDFGADTLTVEKKLIVVDQVEFSSYGNFRYIGSQGQPAFANGWTDFGGSAQSASFTKTADNMVLLHGMIKSGTIGSAAFTLPPGYRPDALITLPAVSNNAFGVVTIDSNGNVTPASPSSNLSVSLDGLWFVAR